MRALVYIDINDFIADAFSIRCRAAAGEGVREGVFTDAPRRVLAHLLREKPHVRDLLGWMSDPEQIEFHVKETPLAALVDYREKLLPLHSVWLDLLILRTMGYSEDRTPVWFAAKNAIRSPISQTSAIASLKDFNPLGSQGVTSR